MAILGFAGLALILSGLLAGVEFAIRWGMHGALASLPPALRLPARRALYLRLRILVGALSAAALLFSVFLDVATARNMGFGIAIAGSAATLAYMLVALVYTMPLDNAITTWDPAALPPDAAAIERRWLVGETIRATVAIAAFVLEIVAVYVSLH